MKKLASLARVLALLAILAGLSGIGVANALESRLAKTGGAMAQPLWTVLEASGREVGELGINGVPVRFSLARTSLATNVALDAFERTERRAGGRCLRFEDGGRSGAACLRPNSDFSEAVLEALRRGDSRPLGALRAALVERSEEATRLVLVEAPHLPLREFLGGPQALPVVDGLSVEKAELFVTDRSRGREEPLLVVGEDPSPEGKTAPSGITRLGARAERWFRYRAKSGRLVFWLRLDSGSTGSPAHVGTLL